MKFSLLMKKEKLYSDDESEEDSDKSHSDQKETSSEGELIV